MTTIKKLIYATLILVLSQSCLDRNREVKRDKLTFKTGDDTELFFKNVRQLYYDLQENSAAKLNVFRLKKRVESEDHPIINLAIVMSYVKDEAYILVEPNELIGLDKIEVEWQHENDKGTIALEDFNRDKMLEFASAIYEGIEKGYDFKITGKEGEFLKDNAEREAFRVTMSDYYRLTRVF